MTKHIDTETEPCNICSQIKHEGCCTCCWYPKACPICGMCNNCGYYPVDIDWIMGSSRTMLRWAYEMDPVYKRIQEDNK